jgi:hypothetical protein
MLERQPTVDMRKAVAWTKQTRGWATELKAALSGPALFVSTVERMASQVREAA